MPSYRRSCAEDAYNRDVHISFWMRGNIRRDKVKNEDIFFATVSAIHIEEKIQEDRL